MLAALGMFVFDTDTALFDALQRQRDWRHQRTDRFGTRAASQFVGPGEDRVTLTGALIPELAGTYSAMETIAAMADEGEAYPLSDGTGTILGTFTIERLSEQKANLIDDGRARRNDFTIELSRVD
jgi:phage protein U